MRVHRREEATIVSRPPLGLPTRFAFCKPAALRAPAPGQLYPALPHQSSAFVKIFAAFARQRRAIRASAAAPSIPAHCEKLFGARDAPAARGPGRRRRGAARAALRLRQHAVPRRTAKRERGADLRRGLLHVRQLLRRGRGLQLRRPRRRRLRPRLAHAQVPRRLLRVRRVLRPRRGLRLRRPVRTLSSPVVLSSGTLEDK